MAYFVYIMASRPGGALYTGRAQNLRQQIDAHRTGCSRHTDKYNIKRLVWFERQEDCDTALRRERALKRWRRAWKFDLIMQTNPHWKDITSQIPD